MPEEHDDVCNSRDMRTKRQAAEAELLNEEAGETIDIELCSSNEERSVFQENTISQSLSGRGAGSRTR